MWGIPDTALRAKGVHKIETISDYLFLGLLILFYLTPSFIAAIRRHRNYIPIQLFNLFFGWTIIGWLAALIWSFTDNTANQEK